MRGVFEECASHHVQLRGMRWWFSTRVIPNARADILCLTHAGSACDMPMLSQHHAGSSSGRCIHKLFLLRRSQPPTVMPGRPLKTTLAQRMYVRRRVRAWVGTKREIYALLASELKVSFRTAERIVQG